MSIKSTLDEFSLIGVPGLHMGQLAEGTIVVMITTRLNNCPGYVLEVLYQESDRLLEGLNKFIAQLPNWENYKEEDTPFVIIAGSPDLSGKASKNSRARRGGFLLTAAEGVKIIGIRPGQLKGLYNMITRVIKVLRATNEGNMLLADWDKMGVTTIAPDKFN